MASGIFAILDDIGALLDDVATASKIATGKTAGILGDDLAVNAEKATGFVSSREIPVLWAITKGSFLNKLIIVPIALLLNFYLPTVINYILMLGGCYLAYEGVEKIIEYLFHKNNNSEEASELKEEVSEQDKIKSAITTDFILSIEIVIIALGSVIGADIFTQIISVCIVAIIATIGVYGIVALIVRMDDAGFSLMRKNNRRNFLYKLGRILVISLPVVIKILGFVGTIALLLVSGGIFVHSLEFLHHFLPEIPEIIKNFGVGTLVGLLVFIILTIFKGLKKVF